MVNERYMDMSYSIVFCTDPRVRDAPRLSLSMHSVANAEIHFFPRLSWANRIEGPPIVFMNFHERGSGQRGHPRRQQLQVNTVGTQSGIDLTTDSRFTNFACYSGLSKSRAKDGFGTH